MEKCVERAHSNGHLATTDTLDTKSHRNSIRLALIISRRYGKSALGTYV